jgi:uncharacterized membrane protein
MARMNDIVSEAFGRLERAVQAQQSSSQEESGHATLIKDAKMLAVPAVAAAAAAAYIASRSRHQPAPAAIDQAQPAAPEPTTSWPEHPAELSPPRAPAPPAAETGTVDPLILEVEQAAAQGAPAFEPHTAVLAPLAAQPAPAPVAPPQIVLPPAPVTDPLILELESGHVPPSPAAAPVWAEPAAPEPVLHPIYVQPPIQSEVAFAAKPVEPRPQWVDHRPTPAPFWAEPSAPQPSRPALTDPSDQHEHGIDPILAGFDHIVCLAGYGLLFASVFMLGVPALAALALAYVHKGDSHLLVRSHFRFQLRIFWTAVLFLALALGALLVGTGLGVGWLVNLTQSNPALSGMVASASNSPWTGPAAGLLMIAAVVLTILAAVWTLGASVLGFLRLIANRPIGHTQVS